MFTVDSLLDRHWPTLKEKRVTRSLLCPILRRILHEKAFVEYDRQNPHLQGIEFVENALDYFNFSYSVDDLQRENIPARGKVVIVANHPIGSLDGLALLKLIHGVRTDVKIVANSVLMEVPALRQLVLPVNIMGGSNGRKSLTRIFHWLEEDHAVIFFPAGEVSRAGSRGVVDGRWNPGFLKIASRTRCPILPIHVKGRNSLFFYLVSLVAKPLSTMLLVEEMFKQRNKVIEFSVGGLIAGKTLTELPLPLGEKCRLLKRHLYRIGKGDAGLFKTENPIAHGERKADLKAAMKEGELLGETPDGKKMILYQSSDSSPVIRELGRLREETFRAVGEGSGRRRDMDLFDRSYKHLILWDDEDLEIAGAYRFADSGAMLQGETGSKGLYSGTLFNYDMDKHRYFLDSGLELGRSFVQQRYWGSRSLDWLWYGIGAYLQRNPHYRYLFGPVSISNAMPPLAKELMIYFYCLYFKGPDTLFCSKRPFRFQESTAVLAKEFSGDNYKADFKHLKALLANLGTAVPPLYKQYTELCEPGGVSFLGFNIDPDFNDCVDGLVIVDTTMIKKKKRRRYIGE